ncbi:MAG: hypothetical protein J6V20_01665 [Bacteroidaceae bacterium]|nr:hypothetical protein [Bacteroidaceae bacterium]
MEIYDYFDAMKEDIKNYIAENYTAEELNEKMLDFDGFSEELNDNLWTVDSVTGNGSGSYTFSRATAKDYILSDSENADLLRDALEEFCVDGDTIAEKFLSEEWEYFDVTIRCYILGGVINEVLEDLKK